MIHKAQVSWALRLSLKPRKARALRRVVPDQGQLRAFVSLDNFFKQCLSFRHRHIARVDKMTMKHLPKSDLSLSLS